ncbi:MAG: hypothetical protein VKL39_13330 [Leptolyngbyaceae bacterium]|nr:hypothetical protein [Leptolyngbyaceae bacterium]
MPKSADALCEAFHQSEIAQFWQAYQATLPVDTSQPQGQLYWVNQFGDTPALIRELTQPVLSGTKTATCSDISSNC